MGTGSLTWCASWCDLYNDLIGKLNLNLIMKKVTNLEYGMFCRTTGLDSSKDSPSLRKKRVEMTVVDWGNQKKTHKNPQEPSAVFEPWLDLICRKRSYKECSGDNRHHVGFLTYSNGIMVIQENVLVLRKYMLRYLQVQCHKICNYFWKVWQKRIRGWGGRERARWNIWGKIIVNSNEGHIGAQAIFFQFYCGFENLKIKKKLEKLEFFSTESILKKAKWTRGKI